MVVRLKAEEGEFWEDVVDDRCVRCVRYLGTDPLHVYSFSGHVRLYG